MAYRMNGEGVPYARFGGSKGRIEETAQEIEEPSGGRKKRGPAKVVWVERVGLELGEILAGPKFNLNY